MKWREHPEHIDTIRTMAAEGSSATEIGEVFQVTRNAIIGAAHRNQIHLRCVPVGPQRPPKPRLRKPHVYPTPYLPTQKSESPQPPPPVPSQPCTLMELTNESCRWIISANGPPYLFCNALEADLNRGVAYCRSCAALAYQPRKGSA